MLVQPFNVELFPCHGRVLCSMLLSLSCVLGRRPINDNSRMLLCKKSISRKNARAWYVSTEGYYVRHCMEHTPSVRQLLMAMKNEGLEVSHRHCADLLRRLKDKQRTAPAIAREALEQGAASVRQLKQSMEELRLLGPELGPERNLIFSKYPWI